MTESDEDNAAIACRRELRELYLAGHPAFSSRRLRCFDRSPTDEQLSDDWAWFHGVELPLSNLHKRR